MTERPTPTRLRRILSRLGIVAVATLVALALAEVVLRVAGYSHHYVNGTASFHEHDPEIGLRGKPDFSAQFHRAEFDVTVSLDEAGFRRLEHGRQIETAETRPRVFAFGDSFTWGWGVDQGEPFVDLLARELGEFEFHNYGLSGTGQVIQYLLFERHVKSELRAGDIVLLQCYENDLLDNLGERMEEWAHARVVEGDVRLIEPPAPTFIWQLKSLLKDNSYLGNLVAYAADYRKVARRTANAEALAKERFELGLSTDVGGSAIDDSVDLPDDSPEVVVLRHFLERFDRDCAAAEAKLAIVCIPGRSLLGEGVGDSGDEPYEAARHRAILRTARALGIPALDLHPHLARAKKDRGIERYTYHYDFHWNPDGHRVAAATIAPFLRSIPAGKK